MSFWTRTGFVVLGTIANALLALLYFRAVTPILDLGAGKYSGPFTSAVGWFDGVIQVAIVLLQLGLLAFWIYGGVREEKARTAVVRR